MSLHDNDKIINPNINSSILPTKTKLQLTTNQHEEPLQAIVSLKDYLHILDRHKSIDNCFLSPPADESYTCCCYYNDEIKKLTNHLFNITKNHYTDRDMDAMQPESCDSSCADTIKSDIDEKVSNGHETPTKGNNQFEEIFKKFTKLADDTASMVSNVPWAVTKRTKFRLSQTSSRDVPIVRTDKPARLTKQNAIDDANDMKLFSENISHKSLDDDDDILNGGKFLLNKSHQHMFQSTFMQNGSISFDCGQLGVEQRSINTIKALFQLHASTGTSVRQMQAIIESKGGK